MGWRAALGAHFLCAAFVVGAMAAVGGDATQFRPHETWLQSMAYAKGRYKRCSWDTAEGEEMIACGRRTGVFSWLGLGGRACFTADELCDGIKHCDDGTDEADCCGLDYIACAASNQCLPGSYLCDGAIDCPDGSDETVCPEVLSRLRRAIVLGYR